MSKLSSATSYKVTILLETVALFTAILTPLMFLVGHSAAYVYYSAFGIPYLKFADLYTGFNFAIESPKIIFILVMISVVIVLNSSEAFLNRFNLNRKLSAITTFLVLIYFSYPLYGEITSQDLKKRIIDKRYVPYEVMLNQEKSVLKCVTSIGSISQYQVFINHKLQHSLVNRANVVYVKPMFSQPPIININKSVMGMVRFERNEDFEAEMKEWLSHWGSMCPSDNEIEFKGFDFFGYK